MNNKKRIDTNRTIHEAMGLCWHEFAYTGKCLNCGEAVVGLNPDYTSDWSAYGKVLEWAQKKTWWEDFAYKSRYNPYGVMVAFLREDLLIPSKGSTALAEFIGAHPEYFTKEGK